MKLIKVLSPTAGHGWTVICTELVSEAMIKAAGFGLSKDAMVIEGTIEFFNEDEMETFVLKMATRNATEMRNMYYPPYR